MEDTQTATNARIVAEVLTAALGGCCGEDPSLSMIDVMNGLFTALNRALEVTIEHSTPDTREHNRECIMATLDRLSKHTATYHRRLN